MFSNADIIKALLRLIIKQIDKKLIPLKMQKLKALKEAHSEERKGET